MDEHREQFFAQPACAASTAPGPFVRFLIASRTPAARRNISEYSMAAISTSAKPSTSGFDYVLVAFFGVSAWVMVSSVYMQLPIYVTVLPEGYASKGLFSSPNNHNTPF
jgi:hypothetical protein